MTDWNADFYSDGVAYWKPVNGYCLLYQNVTGCILPGLSANSNVSLTANVATVVNGAPTAHNIPATTYNGYNVYFPGSSNIPAGWYPTFARTSTTAYTFAYTHADVGSESVNGAGSYLAETVITPLTFNLPGGLLGLSGMLFWEGLEEGNNTAGAKTHRVKFGGSNVTSQSFPNSTWNNTPNIKVLNVDSEAAQIYSSSAIQGKLAIDTTSDVSITQTMTVAVATDFMAIHWSKLGAFLP
jgi:hypothetical protein